MGIFAVILPILVVVGAFVWLRPSGRDQNLAALRSSALVEGFRITSLKVPDTTEYGRVNEKHIIVTLYQRSLVLIEGQQSSFTVLRTTGESGPYLPDGWAWDGRSHIEENQYRALADLLASLPGSIQAINLISDGIALNWDERDSSLSFEIIKETLKQCASLFDRKIVGES